MPFDSFFFQIRPLEMAEIGQNVQKQLFSKHGHIQDSKYPLESGGGWGLFVFHKYFLVFRDEYGRGLVVRFRLLDLNFRFTFWAPFRTLTKMPKSCDFQNMVTYDIVNDPSNRRGGALGAFPCFKNTSLYKSLMTESFHDYCFSCLFSEMNILEVL